MRDFLQLGDIMSRGLYENGSQHRLHTKYLVFIKCNCFDNINPL